MASVPLVPSAGFAFNLPSQGIAFAKTGAVTDFTGAHVNLSTWTAAAVELFSSIAAGQTPPVPVQTITSGITVNSDGTATITLDPAVYLAIAAGGTLNASLYAKPTSGDPLQLLATGTIKSMLN